MSGLNEKWEELLLGGQDLGEGENKPLTPEQKKILWELIENQYKDLHALGLSEAQLVAVLLGKKTCSTNHKKALAKALDFDILSYLVDDDIVSFQNILRYVPSETMEKLLQENPSFFLKLPFDKRVFISFKYGEELLSLDQVLTQEAIQKASQEEVASLFRGNVLYDLSGSKYYKNHQDLGLFLCKEFWAENMIALMNENCKSARDNKKYDSPFTFYFDLFVGAIKKKIFTSDHLRQLITSDLKASYQHRQEIIEVLRDYLNIESFYKDAWDKQDFNIKRFYQSVVPLYDYVSKGFEGESN